MLIFDYGRNYAGWYTFYKFSPLLCQELNGMKLVNGGNANYQNRIKNNVLVENNNYYLQVTKEMTKPKVLVIKAIDSTC